MRKMTYPNFRVLIELAFSLFFCIAICKDFMAVWQSVFSAVKRFARRQGCINKSGDDAMMSCDGGDVMNECRRVAVHHIFVDVMLVILIGELFHGCKH